MARARLIRRLPSPTGCFALALLCTCVASPTAAEGAFPGANGKIAFATLRHEPNLQTCARTCNWEIYSVNPDGTAATRLTDHPARDLSPAWSPDGRKIAFYSSRDGGGIFVMNPDGSSVTFLASDSGACCPAWSPDGDRMAFAYPANDGSEGGVFVMNADGSGAASFIDGDFVTNPDWSPDGHKIAYAAFDYGAQNLYIIGLDYSGYFQTNTPNDVEEDPNWSPDGTKIAFRRYDNGCACTSEIYTMNPDGTGATAVPNTILLEGLSPAWSPDGSRIAFSSGAPHQTDIVTIKLDGTGLTQVTNDASLDYGANWQPIQSFAPYPRPGGATPLLAWLVPAYAACTSPNATHAAPLELPSCSPPVPRSSLLTTSKIGMQKASARFEVVVGNSSTPLDDADLKISVAVSDVRLATDQSDYDGEVMLVTDMRITDRANLPPSSATTEDTRLDLPVTCVPTVEAPRGANCNLTTTSDAMLPNFAKEGKRSVLSTFSFDVMDAGLDESIASPSCPPSCGTGDEQVYLTQGTFLP